MKVSKRDVQLLLGLAGILIVVAVYQLIFVRSSEAADVIKSENDTMQTRVTELEALLPQEDFFVSETERMDAEIDKVFDEFPVDFKPEDGLMFAVALETAENDDLFIPSVNVGTASTAYTIGQAAAEAAAADAAVAAADAAATDTATTTAAAATDGTVVAAGSGKVLNVTSLGLTFEESYRGFKNTLDYITNYPDRRTLNSVSASFNSSTGMLSGSIDVNVFTLLGTEKTYEEPEVPYVTLGTDNIFGTVDTTSSNTGDTDDTAE